MNLCSICGNEIAPGAVVCPYCGRRQPEAHPNRCNRPFVHRTVNIESGRPFVEQAINHLHQALDEARMRHIQVLTVIHGYGSSGRGGAIREECRKLLDHMRSKGELNGYIKGEDFHRRHGQVRDLLKRYPQLSGNANLDRRNQGVTLVIL